ncbi:hypothetical protein [Lachnospira eligens]|uniref:Uncharacterized protein n=1 Tax=Lachnospira eligens TaxID=39485 RepID=A0A415MER9_9FIRM|nr:hypothetical protein [Lachnospira eligens]RHA50385.1 hypothetical protein DW933_02110 [Lachnospira eligens]RHL71208.1 hypothetical protein DW007_03430 [Lachnospira eligens]
MNILYAEIIGSVILGICYVICHIASIVGKCYIAKICKDYSDSKTGSLAEMTSKDININLHH